MSNKAQRYHKEIEKLKNERETLIEISNNLKSKLTQYEDGEMVIFFLMIFWYYK